ncbi:hypothetical protein GQ457_03G045900 [Hibiscus cannabinus]
MAKNVSQWFHVPLNTYILLKEKKQMRKKVIISICPAEYCLLPCDSHVSGAKLLQTIIRSSGTAEGMHLHEPWHVGNQYFHLKKRNH